jgi:putative flippase GtrA
MRPAPAQAVARPPAAPPVPFGADAPDRQERHGNTPTHGATGICALPVPPLSGFLRRPKEPAIRDAIATALLTRLGSERVCVAQEFGRFGIVGTVGFLVDVAVLYAALWLGAGPYGGRLVSYLAAATTTWLLNRIWTFQDRNSDISPVRQWGIFLVVNLVGFASNYGTYALLIGVSPFCARHPVIAVAAGALAGMLGNFALSRRYVFGERQAQES